MDAMEKPSAPDSEPIRLPPVRGLVTCHRCGKLMDVDPFWHRMAVVHAAVHAQCPECNAEFRRIYGSPPDVT